MVRNTEEFVEKAKIKHGEKTYGYDKAIFTKSTNKIIITCHIHGDFEQCFIFAFSTNSSVFLTIFNFC